MAEARDKLRLFLTFSCFTHMLAISFAPRAVIHRCGDTFPLPLCPARAALCLSTASHKSASSLSSRQSDRSPPPPKAENPRCRGALPHRFPLALPLFPAPGFDFVTRTGQAGPFPTGRALASTRGFPRQEEFGSSHGCPGPAHVVPGWRDTSCR